MNEHTFEMQPFKQEYIPTYDTLSVTMYLLWFTLAYGISVLFPTGTTNSLCNKKKDQEKNV